VGWHWYTHACPHSTPSNAVAHNLEHKTTETTATTNFIKFLSGALLSFLPWAWLHLTTETPRMYQLSKTCLGFFALLHVAVGITCLPEAWQNENVTASASTIWN